MLDALAYYFRYQDEQALFLPYLSEHLLLLTCIALIGVGVVFSANFFNNHPRLRRAVEIWIAVSTVCVALCYYGWHVYNGIFTTDTLPLYTCRLAILLGAFTLITHNKYTKVICVYWGFYAIASLLVVTAEPYQWPHPTIVSYWYNHACLIYTSLIIMFWGKGYTFPIKDLRRMLVFMAIYISLSFPIDTALQANYHFYLDPPFLDDLLLGLPFPIYPALVVLSYLSLTCFSFLIGRGLTKRVRLRKLEKLSTIKTVNNPQVKEKYSPAYFALRRYLA